MCLPFFIERVIYTSHSGYKIKCLDTTEVHMKYLLTVFTCLFLFGCGDDKSDDTGSDTAEVVEDSGDTASE